MYMCCFCCLYSSLSQKNVVEDVFVQEHRHSEPLFQPLYFEVSVSLNIKYAPLLHLSTLSHTLKKRAT